jgi:hypothetical protein
MLTEKAGVFFISIYAALIDFLGHSPMPSQAFSSGYQKGQLLAGILWRK